MKTLVRSALMAGALVSTGALAASAAQAQETDSVVISNPAPQLNLSAYGETRVAPDMATISLGVVTEAPTAAEAMRLNAQRMTGVVAALRKQGIADKDVQTSGLNLSAQYTYQDNQPPKLRGYQASNQVTVTVQDLSKLGQAVDATVSAGGNQVNGISFGLKDPQAAENAARLEAVRRLKAKADLYSQALGKRIVGLRSFSEGGGYAPTPPMPMYARSAMAAQDASTPVSPGELNLRIDVNASYELEK
jgi:uncharacterized protein YggE